MFALRVQHTVRYELTHRYKLNLTEIVESQHNKVKLKSDKADIKQNYNYHSV